MRCRNSLCVPDGEGCVKVRPKVQHAMPLEKIREAHRVLATNRVGKVVVKI